MRDEERLRVERLAQGFFRLVAWSGYMESPSVPKLMRMAASLGLPLEPTKTTFYLGRETLLTDGSARMPHWRKTLFAFMSRNSANRPAISVSRRNGWSNSAPRSGFEASRV